MLIVLLGPPGAGKGTQSKKICETMNLFHFSTGDILRNEVKEKTEIGLKIESIINAGNLVGDEIILEIVKKILKNELGKNKGILYDGFPRNFDQANAFESLLKDMKKKINFVIHLSVDHHEILKRIEKRQIDENREDDDVKVLKSRMNVYSNETMPLVDLYEKKNILKTINGMKTVEEVNNDIINCLK